MRTSAQGPIGQATRILIIDDHPTIREGLAARLAREPGLELCGEACDVPDGLQMMTSSDPDLVIVDVSLKTGNGIELVQRIRDRHPTVRVLVWSMYDESAFGERALRAGASGYINKARATDSVIEAIRRVLAGGVYLSVGLAESLVRQFTNGGPRPAGADPISLLSDREFEVFRLIGFGLGTDQIAERMHLSPKTVETYRTRVKNKLGVTTANELVRLAVQWSVANG